jgi:hypothetical protein
MLDLDSTFPPDFSLGAKTSFSFFSAGPTLSGPIFVSASVVALSTISSSLTGSSEARIA